MSHSQFIRVRGIAALVVLFVAVAASAQAEGLTLHVALHGNDAWSGRLAAPKDGDGPFLTLQRARDEIRRMKKENVLPQGGVAVEIKGGIYEMASPLTLTSEDSDVSVKPIVYRARQGEEVRLVGGSQITNFQPVTDPDVLKRLDESARGKVVQADLNGLGVKDFGQPTDSNRPEVFFQDKPMTLARWPNEGFVRIVDVVGGAPHRIHGNPGDKIGRFTYAGDRPSRWIGEKDPWLHGYWFWDWADERQKIESIDPANHVITLSPPYHTYGYRKGQWYDAFNLLSELDTPGEWYLDRSAGVLYFWPPAPLSQGKTLLSVIPQIIKMENASHITVRGLTMEACRGTAVEAGNANDVHVVGCTIRNTGSWAVSLSGRDSSVEGCDIYGNADGGISLSGGDRKTLTPGNLVADNNHIHDYSRWNRICRQGVRITGVGNRVTHNLIHDAPHQAIDFEGNDHLFEFNEIHSVCYESNDAGAIYAGRDWTQRGHVIRYNYLHDISGFEGRGCVGIYLDDQFSSAEMYGNLFHKVTRGAMIGGGRDCAIVNNIFVDCRPAMYIDARGLNWCARYADRMKETLTRVPYLEPLWAGRYPRLPHILDGKPMAPEGNLVARNIVVGDHWDKIFPEAKVFVAMQDNLINEDPKFVDRDRLNFQLKDDSPAYKLGFQRIPIEKMGLYASPNRASWPVQHTVRPIDSAKKAASTDSDDARGEQF